MKIIQIFSLFLAFVLVSCQKDNIRPSEPTVPQGELTRDVCRVICEDIYDIPKYHMIASDVNYVLENQPEW